MSTHIELIDPKEKLSPELGGTGYVGPKTPDCAFDLMVNAIWCAAKWPELNMTVWKVLRSSVNWKKSAKSRRLLIDGLSIPCEVIGSTGEWWFVSTNATVAANMLASVVKPKSLA